MLIWDVLRSACSTCSQTTEWKESLMEQLLTDSSDHESMTKEIFFYLLHRWKQLIDILENISKPKKIFLLQSQLIIFSEWLLTKNITGVYHIIAQYWLTANQTKQPPSLLSPPPPQSHESSFCNSATSRQELVWEYAILLQFKSSFKSFFKVGILIIF